MTSLAMQSWEDVARQCREYGILAYAVIHGCGSIRAVQDVSASNVHSNYLPMCPDLARIPD